jgi:steroid delta-isomerase-like uncharacterized protein
MPTEENKAIVRREVEELYNPDGDLDAVEEIFAPDYVLHDPSLPEEGRGPEAARQLATAFRSAFPDLHTTFDEAVAEGDKVAYRWTASGTHEGELMGIPPTGNRMTITGTAIARISEGRIEEGWQNFDALGMMQQLGAIPKPE